MSSRLPIALQLYTVRADAGADLLGTLDRVAALGYDGVELAGLHGVPAGEVRSRCDELGLALVAAHVGLERVEDELDAVADELASLGTPYLVIPTVRGEATAAARRLARAVATARDRSLRPVFHNHWWEFEGVSGSRLWDAVVAVEGLELELDLGWAWVAGEDPAALVRAHAGRVPLVHVKDHVRRPDGATPDCPVGDGEVGYDLVVPAVRAAGVEWLVVEQDEPGRDALTAAARSLAALRALRDG